MSSADTAVTGLAGRYATALFELAEEGSVLDSVAENLAQLQAMFDESAELRRIIQSPVISRAEQSAVMAALVEKAEMAELTRNFVGLVAQKRRLAALPRIIRAYQALLAAKRGETTAQVVAAKSLTAKQTESLTATLKKGMGKDVSVDVTVNPDLLGGMIVKVGSRMIDSSLRTKLEQLRLTMKGVA
ncbi:F0F1 ATP synthase subunit delta [Magnetospira sp. QH-2]|uniref:F0F1 ATP synthase subunit delta n=1 Tax=Magnetospira sp. (strain QH-2) TaxID=1288970 RepID=UPI0003E81588|nr:F0F1 ATP synthase subunit delta [Magnetospira sp. QH-2]CCQ72365.1 ATP synthase subunit delta, membrane-bound, F1 sector [Magnetospira sp. QH-2]